MFTAVSLADRVEALAAAVGREDVLGSYCGAKLAPQDITFAALPQAYPRSGGQEVDFLSSAGECPFNCHAPITRTGVLRALGGFDESMRDGAEDWEM
jgi:hypothetical protein